MGTHLARLVACLVLLIAVGCSDDSSSVVSADDVPTPTDANADAGDSDGDAESPDGSATPLPLAEEYPPTEPGPYSIGYTEQTFVDASRDDRSLLASIWYPVDAGAEGEPGSYEVLPGFALTRENLVADAEAAAGPFPLIVFSHGNGGTRIQSLAITEALASHGFVVIAPDHTGNTFLDIDDVEAAVRSATDRPPDISFLIDEALRMNESAGVLKGRIDPDRIGVSGHSYGGFTSLAVAAGTPTWPADERIDAIAPLAPASSLVADEYLSTIEIPTLLMGATLDTTTPIDFEITRPFEMIPAEYLYRVDMINGDHNSYTMICEAEEYLDDPGMPPDIVELATDVLASACAPEVVDGDTSQRISTHYLISFFETFLADEESYRPLLAPIDGVDFYQADRDDPDDS